MQALHLSFLTWIFIIVSMAGDIGYLELLFVVAIMCIVYLIVMWLIVISIHIYEKSEELGDLSEYF